MTMDITGVGSKDQINLIIITTRMITIPAKNKGNTTKTMANLTESQKKTNTEDKLKFQQ
jgi:hypothetical protein